MKQLLILLACLLALNAPAPNYDNLFTTNKVPGVISPQKTLPTMTLGTNGAAGYLLEWNGTYARWVASTNLSGTSTNVINIATPTYSGIIIVTNPATLVTLSLNITNNTGLPGVIVGNGIGTNITTLATTARVLEVTNAAGILSITAQQTNAVALMTILTPLTNATSILAITAQQTNAAALMVNVSPLTNATSVLAITARQTNAAALFVLMSPLTNAASLIEIVRPVTNGLSGGGSSINSTNPIFYNSTSIIGQGTNWSAIFTNGYLLLSNVTVVSVGSDSGSFSNALVSTTNLYLFGPGIYTNGVLCPWAALTGGGGTTYTNTTDAPGVINGSGIGTNMSSVQDQWGINRQVPNAPYLVGFLGVDIDNDMTFLSPAAASALLSTGSESNVWASATVVSSNATPVVVQSFSTTTNHLYVQSLQLGAAATNVAGGREFFSVDTSFSLWNSNGATLYMMEAPSVVMSNKTAGLAAAGYDVNFSTTAFQIRFTGVSNIWANVKAKGILTDVTPYDFTTCTTASVSVQPASVTNITNSTLSFTLTATGDATIYYQWLRTNDGNAAFTNLANSTRYKGVFNNTLYVSNGVVAESAYYRCLVTNACGATTSSVVYASFTNGTASAGPDAYYYPTNFVDPPNLPAFTAGPSGPGYNPHQAIYGSYIFVTNGGTITSMGASARSDGASVTLKLALYDSTGALVVATNTVAFTDTAQAWRSATNTPTAISSGVYKLMISASVINAGYYSIDSESLGISQNVLYANMPTNQITAHPNASEPTWAVRLYVD
jgi:hypothetical protein